jgi:predicted transcriptional regulator
MNAPVTITSALAGNTVAALDRLAERLAASREQVVTRAVEEFVARESQLIDMLDAADQQIDRGEYLTQEEMERWFEDRKQSRARLA